MLERISNMTKLVRRSGVAVCLIADLLEFVPDLIIQVGLGMEAHEAAVMNEMWPNAEFIGFEPVGKSFETVSKTYPGEVRNFAISNETRKGHIKIKARHKDGSSLFDFDQPTTSQEVEIDTLDNQFLDAIKSRRLQGKQVLLWLDCEGSELNALYGAELLLPHVQMINVELTAKPPNPSWASSVDVSSLLNRRGFFLQWLHTQRTSAGQCDGIFVRRSIFQSKYCCVPSEISRYNLQGKSISDPREGDNQCQMHSI